MALKAFVAYASEPDEVGQCIESVSKRLSKSLRMTTWAENDVAGRPLVAPIFDGISDNDILIADVTTVNANVTYEIGYAIGSGKRAYLIKHIGFGGADEIVKKIGIFDTLGYQVYGDSEELFLKLKEPIDPTPLEVPSTLNQRAPVYVLETPSRTQGMTAIVSRVKKTKLMYRSFVPSENSRLSATEAIQHVACSFGVIVPWMRDDMRDSLVHNTRASFVAGLAHGMQKPTLILVSGEDMPPLDFRDFVKSWKHPKDLDSHIQDFASDVVQALQTSDTHEVVTTGLLASITIGDPMAENEFQTLGSYYIKTDQFQRTLRGEVNLVVGRKGTGKTALFSQVRNSIRRNKQNIVVDLKPEGYQLVRFKEDVLRFLEQGAKTHLITAFWEYLLYLEVCYKILEKDRVVHLRNHLLTAPYRDLEAAYEKEFSHSEGDFSERLQRLADRIALMYGQMPVTADKSRLSSGEVTSLIYMQDIADIRKRLSEYLEYKGGVWILFDNIDKGWSPQGLTSDDIMLVRGLIDAGRKLEKELTREHRTAHCVIFLRNDVYQLLMDESSDFGKEMRASLDWEDPDLLREMLRARLAVNDSIGDKIKFEAVWRKICVSHVNVFESTQYLIDRSLMRPRNLLKLVAHCKGSAVNLRNNKISEEDILKGVASYSNDLLIDIDQELTDIDAHASELIYVFREEAPNVSNEDLEVLLDIEEIPTEKIERIVDFCFITDFLALE